MVFSSACTAEFLSSAPAQSAPEQPTEVPGVATFMTFAANLACSSFA